MQRTWCRVTRNGVWHRAFRSGSKYLAMCGALGWQGSIDSRRYPPMGQHCARCRMSVAVRLEDATIDARTSPVPGAR